MVKTQKTIYNNIKGDIMPTIFNVIIYPCVDTAGYWATCRMPDGGVNTDGETIQEVERNMFEAMGLYLEDHPEIAQYSLAFEVRNA
jgi:predicted RNase H-like HicB family nuclease